MAALGALPNEILSLITNNLEYPKDVLHLSLVNRRLQEFTKLDGWRAYLQGRFGLSGGESDPRTSVHGLTTLYRNWDRKALVARYLKPGEITTSLNTWERSRWTGPSGQTMGYQPSIDSYEERQGWSDRKEVLAWSAGTHIVMRVKETGSKARKLWEEEHGRETFDVYKSLTSWHTYKIPESSEGRDDITALKLLRPHQKKDVSDFIAFGTASGNLSLLRVDLEHQETKRQGYDTQQRPVSSLSVSPNGRPLIAATLDSSLVLYPIAPDAPEEEKQQPLGEVTPVVPGGHQVRLWSCNFISNDKVSVGLGPTYEPIQIFGVTHTGLSSEPLRKFSLRNDLTARLNTSVYPIVPVPLGSQGGAGAGEVFLSGGYDGIVRLHDMRSPNSFEAMYWDVTNDSSIYSLTTQGLEHVVAGTSMHSMLKVFDLRLSGSHAYRSIPLSSKAQLSKPNSQTRDYAGNKVVREAIGHTKSKLVTGGWNLFLHPRNLVHHSRNLRNPRNEDSPVYSLSIPSAHSPSLYAGVEGAVMGIDFLSVTDKYPDPLYSGAIERFPGSGAIDIEASYNPRGDVLSLGMYEQGNEQALNMRLVVQHDVSNELRKTIDSRDGTRFGILDERWMDPSDESGRWSRGQQPEGRRGGQGRNHAPHRGRGGRGRGRGRGH
jgi:WD40 repeat protein